MKYSLIICFSFLLFESFSQFHDIEGLKKKGRDSILRYTEQILLDRAIYNYPFEYENIRVMANEYEIIVYYKMGFKKNLTDSTFENFDLLISVSEEQISMYPPNYNEYLPEYELSSEDLNTIQFVLKDDRLPFAEDDRIRIEDKGDHYEMTRSRGATGGAECYSIDKITGEASMLWHEMPFDPGNDLPTPPEEVFYEIW